MHFLFSTTTSWNTGFARSNLKVSASTVTDIAPTICWNLSTRNWSVEWEEIRGFSFFLVNIIKYFCEKAQLLELSQTVCHNFVLFKDLKKIETRTKPGLEDALKRALQGRPQFYSGALGWGRPWSFFLAPPALDIIRGPVTEIKAEWLFSRVLWYAEISMGISAYHENGSITLCYGLAKLKLKNL